MQTFWKTLSCGKKIYKKFVILHFMTLIILIQCSSCDNAKINKKKWDNENCKSIKLELLLRNLLKKSFLFPKFITVEEKYDNDTTISYYLRLINFSMPKKDFYVLMSDSYTNDSIKLIFTDNLITKGRQVGVKILEKNEDTSKVKISIGFGANRIASTEGVYSYEFNADSCLWIMKDSTFWQY